MTSPDIIPLSETNEAEAARKDRIVDRQLEMYRTIVEQNMVWYQQKLYVEKSIHVKTRRDFILQLSASRSLSLYALTCH